jgi:hypothetical protein
VKRVGLGLLALGLAGAGLYSAGVLAGTAAHVLDTSSTGTVTVTETTAPPSTAPPTTATMPVTTPATTAPPPTTPKPKVPAAPLRLADGVTIGGVHVGGLGPDAAYQVVRLAFASPLVLLARTQRISVSPEELGAVAYVKAAVAEAVRAAPRASVRLRVRVEGPLLRAYIASLAPELERKPVDAGAFLRNLKPVVTKSVPGLRLHRKAAARAIVDELLANRRRDVRLPLEELKPKLAVANFPIIVIRRSSNTLSLYNGEKLKRLFHVATGQTAYPTPLGRFTILVKWMNPWWYPPNTAWARGAKPIPPGPGNPLGTRWMGLSSPGVGMHGTPDSASIGYSLSHGCIRMLIPDAEWLFDHVDIGSPVFIVAA